MGKAGWLVSLHEEALARPQRGALRALGGRATEEGFYLAGGTAVAIHLGHRRSVDFDWFTLREGWDPLALAGRLQGSDLRFSTEEVAVGTLVARLGRVQMSFIEYRYPLLGSLTRWPEFGCDLASLDDLATMKLAAVAQRGARRDFVDVYALCVQHRPLLPLLELYRSK